jgi:Icc-related predicted phosphoesterase
MKLLHLSDTHGRHSQPFPEAEAILHTGDLLPNKTRGNRHIEPGYQEHWLRSVLPTLITWTAGRPFLFMPGNHDFFDPCPIMRRAGIEAHNLWEDGPKTIDGVRFAGVPHVPWFGGDWNHEAPEAEIEHHLSLLPSVDVLVTHCPPHGVLDNALAPFGRSNAIGSRAIREYVDSRNPTWHLFGHCHEQGGASHEGGGTRFVNGACHAAVHTL